MKSFNNIYFILLKSASNKILFFIGLFRYFSKSLSETLENQQCCHFVDHLKPLYTIG